MSWMSRLFLFLRRTRQFVGSALLLLAVVAFDLAATFSPAALVLSLGLSLPVAFGLLLLVFPVSRRLWLTLWIADESRLRPSSQATSSSATPSSTPQPERSSLSSPSMRDGVTNAPAMSGATASEVGGCHSESSSYLARSGDLVVSRSSAWGLYARISDDGRRLEGDYVVLPSWTPLTVVAVACHPEHEFVNYALVLSPAGIMWTSTATMQEVK